jgi:hypothetical protein
MPRVTMHISLTRITAFGLSEQVTCAAISSTPRVSLAARPEKREYRVSLGVIRGIPVYARKALLEAAVACGDNDFVALTQFAVEAGDERAAEAGSSLCAKRPIREQPSQHRSVLSSGVS